MKNLLVFVLAFSFIGFAKAQNQESKPFQYKNSVQLEAFGHGLYYSLNYERILFNKDRFKTAAQIGVAYYPESTGVITWWAPVVINEMYSMGNHHIELGAGVVITNETYETNEVVEGENVNARYYFYTARLGYRYQKPDSRFLMRLAFTPFFEDFGRYGFHPSGGLAVGYSF